LESGLGWGEEQYLGAPLCGVTLGAWYKGEAGCAHDGALPHGQRNVQLLHLPRGDKG
jgi:hypothetical protein